MCRQVAKIMCRLTDNQVNNCKADIPWISWGKEMVMGWTILKRRYFALTVGKNTNETVIRDYVKNQGQDCEDYKQIHLFK